MNEKSNKVKRIGSLLLVSSLVLTACSGAPSGGKSTSGSKDAKDARDNCNSWVTEEIGEEKCTDSKSSYHGNYLYSGALFANRSALESSSAYKTGLANHNGKTDSKGSNSNTNNGKATDNAKGKGGSNNGLKGGFGSGSRGSGAS